MPFIILIGNKLDNRLQNLSYLSHSEHTILHNIGKNHSTETKAKIRDAHTKKQVYCLELDRIFEGVKIAAKELSLPDGNISNCCNGKRKTCGGYHFQFVNV